MKKRILNMMETSERHASENVKKISTSLENLTSSIADGFSLLTLTSILGYEVRLCYFILF